MKYKNDTLELNNYQKYLKQNYYYLEREKLKLKGYKIKTSIKTKLKDFLYLSI